MNNQELLDKLQIGQSYFSGRVYIGITDKDGKYICKSDFTERLKEFAPQLFERGERRE